MEKYDDSKKYIISSLYFKTLTDEDINRLLSNKNIYFELGYEIDDYIFLKIMKSNRFIYSDKNISIKINSFDELNKLHCYLKDNTNLIFTNSFFEPKNFSKIGFNNISFISNLFKNCNIFFNGVSFKNITELIQFKKYIDIILSHIPYDANELDKVTYLSSFIINYLSFDNESVREYRKSGKKVPIRNEVKTLQDGIGVCKDYAEITKYLFNLVGINCSYVECRHKIKNNEYHAFNIVEINKIPYCLDLSWIEKDIRLYLSTHFLVSCDILKMTHPNYIVDDFYCQKIYPRNDIKQSLERVYMWKNNYRITKDNLEVLLNKNIKNKIEDTINNIDKKRGF